jgi:hypothetical protein
MYMSMGHIQVLLDTHFRQTDGFPLEFRGWSDNSVVRGSEPVTVNDGFQSLAIEALRLGTARVTVTAEDPFAHVDSLSFSVYVLDGCPAIPDTVRRRQYREFRWSVNVTLVRDIGLAGWSEDQSTGAIHSETTRLIRRPE